MFTKILSYEIKHWLRQPSTYIYAFIFFILSFVTLSSMAGESSDAFGGKVANSSYLLYDMTRRFMLFFILILPAVVGVSVYRDFSSNMHHILYSYPFKKRDYLFAKFLSSFLVFAGIVSMLLVGYFLGIQMPWVNPELVKAFDPMVYVQLLTVFILPNLFLVSVVVFGVVVLSRNIYSGFIAVMLTILITPLAGFIFSSTDNLFWKALFDPFGTKAIHYYTQYWTIEQKNNLLLPFHGVFLYNRVLWITIGLGLFAGIYKLFEFHQAAFSLSKKSKTSEKPALFAQRITKVDLPKVGFDFSFLQQVKTTWELSKSEFRYILTSKTFLCLVMGGFLFVMFILSTMNARWETETYPMTWQILELPSQFYSGVINAITFLYAGLLIHRERNAKLHQLVDINPLPNWVFLGSKFFALIKMQALLLSLVMLGGIISQASRSFYDFEIGQYLFNLYAINWIHFVIWAMLALFIQSLLNNPYLGFFVLLFAPIGFISLGEFGPKFGLDFLEQIQFRYNQAPGGVFGLRYSDMDGYGPMLPSYFIYKFYWFLAGLILLVGSLLFWKRGTIVPFGERLQIAKQRFAGRTALGFGLLVLAFLTMGFTLFYENNIAKPYFTKNDRKAAISKAAKQYQHYRAIVQPKITSVKINMNIYPHKREFKANGEYQLFNKSDQPIDTLIINYIADLNTSYRFDKTTMVVSKDTIANIGHFDILLLQNSLMPGDSMRMYFENQNEPTTFLSTNEFVKGHGTYIEDDVFPRLGSWIDFMRESNDLGKYDHRPHPGDCSAHTHSFMGKDGDRIDFEAIVSTSDDQIALSNGHLQKEWTDDNRRYFHYKMNEKIAISYLFMSGDYAIAKDKWEDIDLEIYYHKGHPYNIDRMMDGMKAGLAYCSENFSPYQFKQCRIVEFSQTGRATAHGFPSVIPFGEGAGFIANVDESADGGTDFAFGTAVHEVAHMWWGHQVIPADVLGSKMVVESLAEYTNVRVKEKYKGIDKARKYLKVNMHAYLDMRARESRDEKPLMYASPGQNYIHYPKGVLVFYALSDYIGEAKLNSAIRAYVEEVAFQETTYTTSIEMVDSIRTVVPDSLQYLITDMFETVTLYDNKILDWNSTLLDDGRYQVDIHLAVSKYRSASKGKRRYSDHAVDSLSTVLDNKPIHSLPLADYIDVGIFGQNKEEIYLQKHRFDRIENKLSIIVDKKPTEVAIDPYGKLIDQDGRDNWK